jgi:segregation and condensation protein A
MAATLAEIKSRMLLPRAHVEGDGSEEDPRAELVRRLQEYERFKAAAENIDGLSRLERDVWNASAELKDRKVVRIVPQVTLQEMLLAFKEVVVRSEMFAHHHIQRERLSIRQRMSDIVSSLETASFVEFARLFRPEEGRMGVTVTFVAILELVREGLIEIVQAEPFAPLHVRPAGAHRGLRLVKSDDAGQETIAAEDVDLNADDVAHANEEAKLVDPTFVDDTDFEVDDGPLPGIDDVPGTSMQTDEVAASAEDTVAQAEELASIEGEQLAELEPLPEGDEWVSVEGSEHALTRDANTGEASPESGDPKKNADEVSS